MCDASRLRREFARSCAGRRRAMDRRCFRDTFEAARNDDDPLLRTKRLLRSWLRSDRVVELKTSNDRFDANRYQGYATGVGQRRQYVVRAASMRMRLSRQPGGLQGRRPVARTAATPTTAAVSHGGRSPGGLDGEECHLAHQVGGPRRPARSSSTSRSRSRAPAQARGHAIGRRIRPARRGGAQAIFSRARSHNQ